MLHIVYADDLDRLPKLRGSMFKHRAIQFQERLCWPVHVDKHGRERDEYDDLNPLYVIWERRDGTHGGSMRFLPTTGDTMLNDHFSHLTNCVGIRSPFIWECTRLCIAPEADPATLSKLMLGAFKLGLRFQLNYAVAVVDFQMFRIIRRAEPETIGQCIYRINGICVGLWTFEKMRRARLEERAAITARDSVAWYEDETASLSSSCGVPVDLREYSRR